MGKFDNKHPWELCTTLTTGAWGYQPNAQIKTLQEVVRLLVGAVGRDGNLLLNVGPQPDGQIVPEQANRLKEVGEWLSRYGQSIYRTRGGPYLPGDFGVSTYRDTTIYLHIFNSAGTTLSLPSLPARILNCANLTGGRVDCRQSPDSVVINLKGSNDAVDTIVSLSLASSASEIQPIETPESNRH
jgi:alpha-L-fucosidase